MGTTEAKLRRMPWWMRLYRWATLRLYDELAWAYDAVAWVVSLGHWARWRREALAVLAPELGYQGRILELGFGTGVLLLDMARQGRHAVGLDSSLSMHRVSGRKLRRNRLSMPRVLARAQAMPFADASFDAVLSTFPAEYILSPQTLHEAARVLRIPDPAQGRPGGMLVIAGLCFETDSPWLRTLAGWIYGPALDRVLEYYRPLAEVAGFEMRVVADPTRHFRLPILVLERRDDA